MKALNVITPLEKPEELFNPHLRKIVKVRKENMGQNFGGTTNATNINQAPSSGVQPNNGYSTLGGFFGGLANKNYVGHKIPGNPFLSKPN